MTGKLSTEDNDPVIEQVNQGWRSRAILATRQTIYRASIPALMLQTNKVKLSKQTWLLQETSDTRNPANTSVGVGTMKYKTMTHQKQYHTNVNPIYPGQRQTTYRDTLGFRETG